MKIKNIMKKGFTLIECVVTIAVISIITVVAVTSYNTATVTTADQWNKNLSVVMADNALSAFKAADSLGDFETIMSDLTAFGSATTTPSSISVSEQYTEMKLARKRLVTTPFDAIRAYTTGKVCFEKDGNKLITFDYTLSGNSKEQYAADVANALDNAVDTTTGESLFEKVQIGDSTTTLYVNMAAETTSTTNATTLQYCITSDTVTLHYRYGGSTSDRTKYSANITYDTTPIEKYFLAKNQFLIFNNTSVPSIKYSRFSGQGVTPDLTNYAYNSKKTEGYMYFAVMQIDSNGSFSQATENGRYVFVRLTYTYSSLPTQKVWSDSSQTGFTITKVEKYTNTNPFKNTINSSDISRCTNYSDTNDFYFGWKMDFATMADSKVDLQSSSASLVRRYYDIAYSSSMKNKYVTDITSEVMGGASSFNWKYYPTLAYLGIGSGYNNGCGVKYILNTNYFSAEHDEDYAKRKKGDSSYKSHFVITNFGTTNGDFPEGKSRQEASYIGFEYRLKNVANSEIYYALTSSTEVRIYGPSDIMLFNYFGNPTNPLNDLRNNCGMAAEDDTSVTLESRTYTKHAKMSPAAHLTGAVFDGSTNKIFFYNDTVDDPIVWFTYDDASAYEQDKLLFTGAYKSFYDSSFVLNVAGDPYIHIVDGNAYEVIIKTSAGKEITVFRTTTGSIGMSIVVPQEENVSGTKTTTISGTTITQSYIYRPNHGVWSCYITATFSDIVSRANGLEPRIKIWVIPSEDLPASASNAPTTTTFINYRKG